MALDGCCGLICSASFDRFRTDTLREGIDSEVAGVLVGLLCLSACHLGHVVIARFTRTT